MKLIFIVFMLLFIGCDTVEIQDKSSIQIDKIKKEWTHSSEEETDSIQIYRPSGYKEFPVSWYRQKYSFSDSGKCKYLVLSPNDAHYFKRGFWSYNEAGKVLTITDSSRVTIKRVKVITLTKDLLKFIEL